MIRSYLTKHFLKKGFQQKSSKLEWRNDRIDCVIFQKLHFYSTPLVLYYWYSKLEKKRHPLALSERLLLTQFLHHSPVFVSHSQTHSEANKLGEENIWRDSKGLTVFFQRFTFTFILLTYSNFQIRSHTRPALPISQLCMIWYTFIFSISLH